MIAAGLVMTAIHTANEAGWLTVGQQQAADLSWLVRPGTPVESLVSGVLGIQPYPVWAEVIGYFAYLVPMLALVALPRPRRRVRTPCRRAHRARNRALLAATLHCPMKGASSTHETSHYPQTSCGHCSRADGCLSRYRR